MCTTVRNGVPLSLFPDLGDFCSLEVGGCFFGVEEAEDEGWCRLVLVVSWGGLHLRLGLLPSVMSTPVTSTCSSAVARSKSRLEREKVNENTLQHTNAFSDCAAMLFVNELPYCDLTHWFCARVLFITILSSCGKSEYSLVSWIL